MASVRIWADANSCTEDRKLLLSVYGALQDIEKLAGQLRPGMSATFYSDDFEVQGTLEYDEVHGIWLGVPDWNTWKDLC